MYRILTVPVTDFYQNCRIFINDNTKVGAIVDPGGDADRILAKVALEQIAVEAILLTHAHLDHCGAVAKLIEVLSTTGRTPSLIGHAQDRTLRCAVVEQAKLFGCSQTQFQNCPEPTRLVEDGEEIDVCGAKARVLFVPGHAPGHIAFHFDSIEAKVINSRGDALSVNGSLAFVGDVIFAGGIGRTDLPGGSLELLMNSINGKILTLAQNTVLLTGHGPDTTVFEELRSNPFLLG